jgi:VIT1/CCC1 family predicted Fe2+/Mn2+ transporter
MLGWRIPEDTHLALYLGRSLGVVALGINAITARAAQSGDGMAAIFCLTLAISTLMVPLHIWGWIRKTQPLSESLEVFFWAALAALTLAFWPIGQIP